MCLWHLWLQKASLPELRWTHQGICPECPASQGWTQRQARSCKAQDLFNGRFGLDASTLAWLKLSENCTTILRLFLPDLATFRCSLLLPRWDLTSLTAHSPSLFQFPPHSPQGMFPKFHALLILSWHLPLGGAELTHPLKAQLPKAWWSKCLQCLHTSFSPPAWAHTHPVLTASCLQQESSCAFPTAPGAPSLEASIGRTGTGCLPHRWKRSVSGSWCINVLASCPSVPFLADPRRRKAMGGHGSSPHSALLDRLSFFPALLSHSLPPASWDHLPNELPIPKSLSQILLSREPKPKHLIMWVLATQSCKPNPPLRKHCLCGLPNLKIFCI